MVNQVRIVFISLMCCVLQMGCNQLESQPGKAQASISALTPTVDLEVKTSKGSSCQSDDPTFFCLGLKYVVYKDSSGQPVVTKDEALNNVKTINKLWAQCNIGFQIDEYQAVDPTAYGLEYSPANDSELSAIRESFADESKILVVTTGRWNRYGTLGNTGANAWTSLPGDYPLGAVLEGSVGVFPNIIAHELGHYMSLLHIGNTYDLMDPIIYDNSTALSSDQCVNARSAVGTYWQRMVR